MDGVVEKLRKENAELRTKLDVLSKQVEELLEQNRRLTKAVNEAKRSSKRQAAPFRRKRRKTAPKKPGRKPGHKGAARAVPDRVDRKLQGPPLCNCPHCGHGFADGDARSYRNYETELPPIEPVVTEFVFDGAWCPRCEKVVYAPHVEQTSTASGAAASHLGPRARSFMVDLKHRLGVPYGKLADVLDTHFNLKVSPGGIIQASYRLAELARPTFEAIQQELARSSLVHADETGWRVQSENWWLWVACTEQFTIYRITDHRSAKVIPEILGPNFAGQLFRDGWASYDKQLKGWSMLRCLLHLKHNAEDLLNDQSEDEGETPGLFLQWFNDVLALKKASVTSTAEVYTGAAAQLVQSWEWMLEHLQVSELSERNQRFRQRMADAQEQILPILHDPALPAANNRAEQQIRPAVIIRKISAGNRTERGARTHEVLASLAATCRQQAIRFADVTQRILRATDAQPIPFWEPVPS